MANLYSSRQTQSSTGFNPQVLETPILAQASTGAKVGWWILYALSWLTIIFGIVLTVVMIKRKNSFIEMQTEIEEASSQIQVEQKKRYDTLLKVKALIESDQAFEKDTFAEVTALRSGAGQLSANQAMINKMQEIILGQIEAYPNLKSHQSVMEGISTSQVIEQEIAASRRVYNSRTQKFNASINTWPGVVFASKMGLETFIQFAADAQSTKDVDMTTYKTNNQISTR